MSADLMRRAYELGRIRTSIVRAAAITVGLGAIAWIAIGREALAWLPITMAAWTFALWRGEAIQKGAFFGSLGGLAAMVVPMSVLRPSDCSQPECCLEAGVLIGALLATAVPVERASWWKTSAGLVLGIASVAMLRCGALYLGEALGLVGGLLAGVAVASLARRIYSKTTSTSAS